MADSRSICKDGSWAQTNPYISNLEHHSVNGFNIARMNSVMMKWAFGKSFQKAEEALG